jgi:hypothetical protein
MEVYYKKHIEQIKQGVPFSYKIGIASGVWDTYTESWECVVYMPEEGRFEVCHYYAPRYGEDYGHYYKYLSEEELIEHFKYYL